LYSLARNSVDFDASLYAIFDVDHSCREHFGEVFGQDQGLGCAVIVSRTEASGIPSVCRDSSDDCSARNVNMVAQTLTADENGHLEIICRHERNRVANASLTSLEGEVLFAIDDLDPGESVQVDIGGSAPPE
jgi:hypothetical protein